MRSNIAAPSRRLFLGAIAPVLAAVALGPAVASIAVVGDSLAAGCPFRTLSCRHFEVINLAKGGARLADITGPSSPTGTTTPSATPPSHPPGE